MATAPTKTDAGLVARLQERDRAAWDELYREYEERLSRFAYRLTGNEHDAADLVVGVGEVGGVDVGLADVELLRVIRQRVPRGDVFRPGGELGVLRDHPELLLIGEDRVAQHSIGHELRVT